MYVVVRRTWLAGADPTGAPDSTRTSLGGLTRAAAMARAEQRARAAKGAYYDPETDSWWAKAPNALHQFVVMELGRRG